MAEEPAQTDAPTPGELAAAKRRKAAAQQRSRWLEQYLGDGWVELEPGIFSFNGSPVGAVQKDE